jgi:SAM-dependent methyltransferase
MRHGLARVVGALLARPRAFKAALRGLPSMLKAIEFSSKWRGVARADAPNDSEDAEDNPLLAAFRAHKEGRGIWKWDHYFDIYHRHLRTHIGRRPSILEIGVFSGGSLDLWKQYFGPGSAVYGVDIQESCRAYEEPGIRIFIGDQGDRAFWQRFKGEVPYLDVVIDDGSHRPDDQVATLEELLPHLRPGGVYICEDIHGPHNEFAAYVHGLAHRLNETRELPGPSLAAEPSEFQKDIHAIHSYPFAIVIERSRIPRGRLHAPRHGTKWQPFVP